MNELRSPNGIYWLVLQDDGSLVRYRNRVPYDYGTGVVTWAAPDAGGSNDDEGAHPPDLPGPLPADPQGPPPGPAAGRGIVEPIASGIVRPRLTREQMAAFLPATPGPFTFPAPYGTRGIRLTSPRDGTVHPLGMSYWPNINHHGAWPDLFVLVSINEQLRVLEVNKSTGAVLPVMALPFGGTGEGCYWSFRQPHILYVPAGDRLLFYNVTTEQSGEAFRVGDPIRQVHSSYNGDVHSFTLGGGAAVFRNSEVRLFTPPFGGYDECQIDKSGRWLVVKCTGPDDRPANWIHDLGTGQAWWILDAEGAVGHSDMGWNYMIGEEDQAQPGGVFRLWVFTTAGPLDLSATYWTNWTTMSRYVSHCNAMDAQPSRQRFLFSGSHTGDSARANELVVVDRDSSDRCRSVCPNLNILDPDADYWQRTRANICPAGEWAAFWANMGTERGDLFLVEL